MRTYRTAAGGEVPIARFGSGPLVVCVPLVPEVEFVYTPQIQHLADRFEVVLYRPNLSRSHRVSVADRQAELESVLDLLGGGPVHLLAWSDGGSVAYRAVRSRPERFRSLALLGLADRYAFPAPVQALTDLLYERPIEWAVPTVAASALLARYLGGPRFSRGWLFREARRIERLPQYLRHSILPLMLEHEPDGSRCPVPSVVIGGDRDALVPVDRMRRMAALLGPDTEFVVVPGGEHMLGYVSPQQVDDALDGFYDRLGAAQPAPAPALQ